MDHEGKVSVAPQDSGLLDAFGEGDAVHGVIEPIATEGMELEEIALAVQHEHEQASTAFGKGLNHAIRAGGLLIEAKRRLEHGGWLNWIENNCHIPERTATRYMRAAGNQETLKSATVADLGLVGADNLIKAETKQARRTERLSELSDKTEAAVEVLGIQQYNVILADPPWRFEPYSRDTGMDRAADNHYQTMTVSDIADLDVFDASMPDSVLFLWATAPMLEDALLVMSEWGFTYKSHMVWAKDRIGTGYWFRSKHELLLVGTRGNIPAPEPGTQSDSVLEWPVTAHSEKPAAIHDMIVKIYPDLPRLEMFARSPADGWDSWGNEND